MAQEYGGANNVSIFARRTMYEFWPICSSMTFSLNYRNLPWEMLAYEGRLHTKFEENSLS